MTEDTRFDWLPLEEAMNRLHKAHLDHLDEQWGLEDKNEEDPYVESLHTKVIEAEEDMLSLLGDILEKDKGQPDPEQLPLSIQRWCCPDKKDYLVTLLLMRYRNGTVTYVRQSNGDPYWHPGSEDEMRNHIRDTSPLHNPDYR